MADNSKSNKPFDGGISKANESVLRARDVIPSYGNGRNEGKVIIPKFDLSQEIMAGQRKATAEKRQGPGENVGVQEPPDGAEGRDYRIERLYPERTEEDIVLAEIVARDIARLCGAECSGHV